MKLRSVGLRRRKRFVGTRTAEKEGAEMVAEIAADLHGRSLWR